MGRSRKRETPSIPLFTLRQQGDFSFQGNDGKVGVTKPSIGSGHCVILDETLLIR